MVRAMPTATNLIARSLCLVAALCLAKADLRAFQQIPGAPPIVSGGETRIAGTVVSKADGHPLPQARVTLRDAREPQKFQSLVASDNGKFEFTGLPAGKYDLEGAKRGYISAGYEQHDQYSTAIVTGAGLDTEALTLRLAPDAIIAGRVLDEVGEPVRHARVTLYYNDHQQGLDQIHPARNAQTDDQGSYEMTPLRPGIYFLSASAKPWYAMHAVSQPEGPNESPLAVDRSLDVAYPITYYPDVTETESAAPIPIRGGEHLELDIHLNPVPALRLRFRIAGNEKSGFVVPQLQQPAFDDSTFIQSDGGRLVSPGVFEITGVPAGRYNLRFNGPEQATEMNGIDLAKDGEEIDTSKSEALSTVKLSVVIPGEATLPPRLIVGLRSSARTSPVWQMANPKGEFEFPQLAAGRYEVFVGAPGKAYSISHMAPEGVDGATRILMVAPGSATTASLTLVGGSVEVSGTVKRAGQPFAGAMVVLVPKNPELHRDLFRRDQSDLDGTFSLRSVIPSSYTIVAIENGWDLDWSQPGVIAAYTKRGLLIQVNNQVGHAMKLAEPVELQSK